MNSTETIPSPALDDYTKLLLERIKNSTSHEESHARAWSEAKSGVLAESLRGITFPEYLELVLIEAEENGWPLSRAALLHQSVNVRENTWRGVNSKHPLRVAALESWNYLQEWGKDGVCDVWGDIDIDYCDPLSFPTLRLSVKLFETTVTVTASSRQRFDHRNDECALSQALGCALEALKEAGARSHRVDMEHNRILGEFDEAPDVQAVRQRLREMGWIVRP
jgi:hypothetical protein